MALSALALCALGLFTSFAPRWIAFAQQPPQPAFEAASIKPGESISRQFGIGVPGTQFIATNASLRMMIAFAWDVRDHQILGGPKWSASDRFSIEAKHNIQAPLSAAGMERLTIMLQSLLEERFKLRLHRETRVEQVYELVVAKGGAKLNETHGPDKDGRIGIFGRGRGVTVTAQPISAFANFLAGRLGRSVIDKTGLSGKYDFALAWKPDPSESTLDMPSLDSLPSSDPDGPSLFTALQEQLGLKLAPAKGPVEVLVVDSVEKPDAN